MKLSIIIVSWNVRADIINCLGSIYKNPSSSPFEVILIDNASSDKTVECIQKEFSQVVCIANNDNRGFAGANNQGIEIAKGEYLLFLNPDTIIHKGTLDYLVDFMDNNKEAGACGPQLLNEDGSIQRSVRRFPSFRGALYRFTFLKYFKIFKKDYRNWLARDFDHKSQIEVDQLMGAALLVRKSITDNIGGFDERYFMYYEEVDLCCRIKHDGWQIVFLPQVRITHLGGRSSQQIPAAKRIMMLRSMLKYFRKHRGIGITFLFNCFFKIGVLLREIVDLVITGCIYILSCLMLDVPRCRKYKERLKSGSLFLFQYITQLFSI